MADLILPMPDNVDDASTNTMWTPTEVEYIQSWVVPTETPLPVRVIKHEFKLSFHGDIEYFGVMGMEDEDESLIEDMAAATAEAAMVKIIEREQIRGGRLIPVDLSKPEHLQVRRDLAATFREFRAYQRKRRESTNGKIYYPGVH